MKIKLIAVLLIVCAFTGIGQTVLSSNPLEKKIINYFSQHTPESKRYNSLTYGEKTAVFKKEQIDQELQLFEEIKKSSLIEHPTTDVFDLCHNILIHSPEQGREFLTLLNHPNEDKETLMPLYMDAIFTGEFGEQLALKNLRSENADWRNSWSIYIGSFAIYESSIPVIEKTLEHTTDPETQRDLIGALTFISDPKSLVTIKKIIESTKNDETQAKSIFSFTELAGYDGIDYLEKITPVGNLSTEEKKSSLEWLKKETSASNKYGVLVTNDIDFITSFADNKSPSVTLMKREGLFDTTMANHPKALPKIQKNALIDALIESKGFGLEAVKAQLFLSLDQADIPRLLALRQACVYAPNGDSFARLKTVGLFIRYLRKTKK